jgi:hypothetical protein
VRRLAGLFVVCESWSARVRGDSAFAVVVFSCQACGGARASKLARSRRCSPKTVVAVTSAARFQARAGRAGGSATKAATDTMAQVKQG